MATPMEQMVKARGDLLLDQPFFGVLALRLKLVEDPTCRTAWVDGVSLGYNPAFIAGLTSLSRQGLVAHEVMHVAAGHPWRRDDRELTRWQKACDHAINPTVRAAHMDLPEGAIEDPQFAGLSAEAIYTALPTEPEGQSKPEPQPDEEQGEDDDAMETPDGGAGDGGVDDDESGPGAGDDQDDEGEGSGEGGTMADKDPGACGEVRDCPCTAEQTPEQTHAEWQTATIQAASMATARGTAPAGTDRIVEEIRKPACDDLLAALREFVARSAAEDYSWTRPNRRYLANGLYLPSLHSEGLPQVAAAVDTSGSIDEELLAEFVGALQVVLDDARPESLRVIACDAEIHAEREYLPGEELDPSINAFPGGGGTNFVPVFDRLAEDEPPACAIYLTDLYGCFPETAPDYPVLWVVSDRYGRRTEAPFGTTIWVNE